LFQVYSTPDDKNLLLKNFDFLTADTMIVSQQDGTVAVIDTRTSKWVYEIIQSITSGWVLSLIQDLINWRLFYLHNKMKTDFVIQIVQLDQYGTKSANLSYWLALIQPLMVFQILSRFYIHINDRIETLCHCRLQSLRQSCKDRGRDWKCRVTSNDLMRPNGKETKEDQQMKLFHFKSKCNKTRKSLNKHCSC
jgi:hypothetical protein